MSNYHKHQHIKKHRVLVAKKRTKALFVDRLTYTAAVLEPLITLPQVYVIFRTQSAAGISILTWVGYELMTLIWVWYAIAHKERLILVYQGLFAIFQLGVIAGAVLYGGKLI